jgi:S-formylglutathione hydrolase FrmB
VSLVSGFLPIAIFLLAIGATAFGVDFRRPRWAVRVVGSAVAAAVLVGLVALGQHLYYWVPYPFPISYYLWVAVPAWALCLLTSSARGRRNSRASGTFRWASAVAAVLAVPLTVTMVAVKINSDFGYYPTVASLTGDVGRQSSLDALARARHLLAAPTEQHTVSAHDAERVVPMPAGESLPVDIPATRSHFRARIAWVWVPPAYVAGRDSHLPVIMLLAGTPSQTTDWLRAGDAGRTAQAYATRHGGVSPILVMPDENGTGSADTECVNGRSGNAETYLSVDVPAFMHTHFGASLNRSWAVAGLSEGGTCAVMLALRHPQLFRAFADYSGLTGPSLTNTVAPTVDARSLFGGNLRDFDEHDPLWLLGHDPSHAVTAIWDVGSKDQRSLAAQRALVQVARHSHMTVIARQISGARHSFIFWAQAFAETLPALVSVLASHPTRRT